MIKLLLKLFPKPDFSYVLDAQEQQLQTRSKTDREQAEIQAVQRKVFPTEYIQQQRKNFLSLALLLRFKIINTNQNIKTCTQQIIYETWKKLL